MEKVTWKATFIGAFVLFLIGVVAATWLNYAEAAWISIAAGIAGPFKCRYNGQDPNSRVEDKKLCNQTDMGFTKPEACIFIYVSYIPSDDSDPLVHGIKLSPSYTYNTPKTECSAKYCGTYIFKEANDTTKYRDHPALIKEIEKAERVEGDAKGILECYLNPNKPKAGAYLNLNEKKAVTKPQQRIFKFYEGWLVLMAPAVVSLAIIVFLVAVVLRRRLASNTVQKPKGFVPPGFAPIMSTEDT